VTQVTNTTKQQQHELIVLLGKMDELFDGLFIWLAGQYEPVTGGFYYARSSVRDARFTPDIESTAQGLNMLQRHDLLDTMPEKMRRQMVQFFQNNQQPDTGYFLDAHPAMRNDEVMVHRAIGYSTNALLKLGGEALYPLPLVAKAAPDYVRSPEAYLEKWKSIDLSNSWRGCDRLATSCVYMSEMPEDKRRLFLNAAVKYLAEIQDPETGLWGEGSLYVRISGTFKLHTFYSKFGIPMPNPDKIYQTILHCLRTEEAADMCYIRNPIDLLSYLGHPVPYEELVEILEITVNNMRRLKRADGGFSRELEHSPPAPNVAQVKRGEYYPGMPEPVCIGLGWVEGDMNASTQATLIRQQTRRLAGIAARPLEESKTFYQTLK
jgi:hypothetical protein